MDNWIQEKEPGARSEHELKDPENQEENRLDTTEREEVLLHLPEGGPERTDLRQLSFCAGWRDER